MVPPQPTSEAVADAAALDAPNSDVVAVWDLALEPTVSAAELDALELLLGPDLATVLGRKCRSDRP
jgi:hypothetical protein